MIHRGDILDDKSPMPYGKHEGTAMANVPPKDLLWLYDNNRCSIPVRIYIEENLEDLKAEAKK